MTDVLSQLVETEKFIHAEHDAYGFVTIWHERLPYIKSLEEIQQEIDSKAIQIKHDSSTDRSQVHYFETLKQNLKFAEDKNLSKIHRSRARVQGVIEGLEFAINCKGDFEVLNKELEYSAWTLQSMKARMSEGASPLWVSGGYLEGLKVAIKIVNGEDIEL